MNYVYVYLAIGLLSWLLLLTFKRQTDSGLLMFFLLVFCLVAWPLAMAAWTFKGKFIEKLFPLLVLFSSGVYWLLDLFKVVVR